MTEPDTPTTEPLTPEQRLEGQIAPWDQWEELGETGVIARFDEVMAEAGAGNSQVKRLAVIAFGNYVWVNHRDWKAALQRANEELGKFSDVESRRWA